MNKLRDFKFVITLVLKLKRTINENETKYSTLFSNSKAETNSHDADIDSILESIYNAIMTKILKYQAEGLGWTIYLVIEQNINILKYKSLSSSNDINLPKELNHS